MKILTVHQLWAWAIEHGHKTIENRGRKTSYRGPLAIHAGKSRASIASSAAMLERIGLDPPDPNKIVFGAVVAVGELVDCIEHDPKHPGSFPELKGDPWATGPQCWKLANMRSIEPIYCDGCLDLWERPEIVWQINEALKRPRG